MPSRDLDGLTQDLSNPIWVALTTRHAHFAQGRNDARLYPPNVTPLAGTRQNTRECLESLAEFLQPDAHAALFLTELPPPKTRLQVLSHESMLQMMWGGGELERASSQPVPLEQKHVTEMLALAELTKPGPFGARTIELGRFRGIFEDGKLAAMAGQRLQLPRATEISGVCTHPAHRGKGYAVVLLQSLLRDLCECGDVPFLHVRANNAPAIRVYEKLGFRRTRPLHLVVAGRE